MRPMHREVPKDEDSEPEKAINSAHGCTPLAAAVLEWDDDTPALTLSREMRRRGLSITLLNQASFPEPRDARPRRPSSRE